MEYPKVKNSHVLMMYPSFEFGGVVRHLLILSKELTEQGVSVSLFTGNNERMPQSPLYFNQIIRTRLTPSNVLNLLKGVGLLIHLHSRLHYTILHSHHRFTTLMGKIASNLLEVPLVSTVHEFKNDHAFFVRYSLPDRIICPTQALAYHLENNYGLPKSRIVIVPNGLPDSDTHQTNSFDVSPLFLPDRCSIGFIGRLSAEKGCDDFINAATIVLAKEPSAMFYMIGDGPQRYKLERLINQLSISDHFKLLGFRPDADKLIRYFDILVIPSHTENFPYTLLEAMRAKVPVVATRVGGIPEILDGYPSDLLIEPQRINDLVCGILKLIRDPELRRGLGEQNYVNFREKYSSKKMIRGTLDVYDHLIQHKK